MMMMMMMMMMIKGEGVNILVAYPPSSSRIFADFRARPLAEVVCLLQRAIGKPCQEFRGTETASLGQPLYFLLLGIQSQDCAKRFQF
mmetsp:Transcript_77848/g.141604  ORF Transcript_77848/g.141604 Transcript_77848/m.141604 type:complete len:87 (-) Transcript_77848:343-603(-)